MLRIKSNTNLTFDLEKTCDDCDGTGNLCSRYATSEVKINCYFCHGSGLVLNDNGIAILELIKNYKED